MPVPPPVGITIPVNNASVRVRIVNEQAIPDLPTGMVNELIRSGADTIAFNLSHLPNVSTVTLPRNAVTRFADDGLDIQITFASGTVYVEATAGASIASQAATTNISFTLVPVAPENLQAVQQRTTNGDNNVFRLAVTSGTRDINSFAGALTVTVPFEGTYPVAVWQIGHDGTKSRLYSSFCHDSNRVVFVVYGTGVFAVGPYISAVQPLLRLVIGQRQYMQDGVARVNDVEPFIVNNRTMVPLRLIAEALGATVFWDTDARAVDIVHGETILRLAIDVPLPDGMGTPQVVNNRTFVPARYVSEFLGATVRWDPYNTAVYVYSGSVSTSPAAEGSAEAHAGAGLALSERLPIGTAISGMFVAYVLRALL